MTILISFLVHIMYLIIRINALLHQSQINEMNVMLQHIHDFNAHNQLLTSSRFTITLWCFSLSVTYHPPGDFDRIVLFVFISILQKVFRHELKRDDNTIGYIQPPTSYYLNCNVWIMSFKNNMFLSHVRRLKSLIPGKCI